MTAGTTKKIRAAVEQLYISLIQLECDRYVASRELVEDYAFAKAHAVLPERTIDQPSFYNVRQGGEVIMRTKAADDGSFNIHWC